MDDYDKDADKIHGELNDDEDDEVEIENEEEEEEEDTTTTTTTTTRSTRPPFAFPTRNRDLIPSRRPNQRKTTTTTTIATDFEQEKPNDEYDGDFRYIRDFRVYIQKIMEDIKKFIGTITNNGDLFNDAYNAQYNRNDDE